MQKKVFSNNTGCFGELMRRQSGNKADKKQALGESHNTSLLARHTSQRHRMNRMNGVDKCNVPQTLTTNLAFKVSNASVCTFGATFGRICQQLSVAHSNAAVKRASLAAGPSGLALIAY